MSPLIRKILGVFVIAAVILITITLIKKLPPIMKLVALTADVIAIYYAVILIKNKKSKDEKSI